MESALKTLSLVILLVGTIQGHEHFESEVGDQIGKQAASATGVMLGDYGVAFERDLPIYMTTELLFSEVVDTGRAIMHPSGIFANP